jgi:hypothetical protein
MPKILRKLKHTGKSQVTKSGLVLDKSPGGIIDEHKSCIQFMKLRSIIPVSRANYLPVKWMSPKPQTLFAVNLCLL